MRRLIIHLKKVNKVKVKNKTKIFNTLNIPVNSERDINFHLEAHGNNISSYQISNYK